MNPGERIKQLRLARGMTLEELGHRVGVGKSTVRKWETGAIANMRRDKIAKLAEALDTDVMDIIGIYNEEQEPEEETVQAGTVLSAGEAELVDCYRSLNPDGQTAALAAVRGLTCLPEYRQDSPRASAS